MDVGALLREARGRAGLTQRLLARRGATSHSTLAAYETGAKVPTIETLERIVRAAGFELRVSIVPADPFEDRRAHGDRLGDVLDLAEAFPARHERTRRFPRLPGAR